MVPEPDRVTYQSPDEGASTLYAALPAGCQLNWSWDGVRENFVLEGRCQGMAVTASIEA